MKLGVPSVEIMLNSHKRPKFNVAIDRILGVFSIVYFSTFNIKQYSSVIY